MLKLWKIADLSGGVGQEVQCLGWLTAIKEQVMKSGDLRVQLILGDSSGSVLGFIWPEVLASLRESPAESPQLVTAEVRSFNGPQLRITDLEPVDPDAVESGAALLPLHRCPKLALGALHQLKDLEVALPPPLAGFLKRVLLDPAIGLPLLRCRASASDHHAEAGGLLVHCTDLLDVAAQAAKTALPQDPLAAPMAQLGYLLHDLGKLRSVGEWKRPPYPFALRHETMTVDLLSLHLKWLDRQDPELGLGLRYIFEYLSIPPKGRPAQAEYLVAEIVASLDHWSAAAPRGRDLSGLLKRVPVYWNLPAANENEQRGERVAGRS